MSDLNCSLEALCKSGSYTVQQGGKRSSRVKLGVTLKCDPAVPLTLLLHSHREHPMHTALDQQLNVGLQM